jgi:methanogenic corrinoid protein MtbC1
MSTIEELIEQMKEAVIEGEEEDARAVAVTAIQELKIDDPIRLVREGIQPAMDQVGRDFETGEAFLPNLMCAGDAAIQALEIILPALQGDDSVLRGTVVLGTVFGDLHDIGKNITSAILTANGFKVVDLGVNVMAREFLTAAEKEGAQIIATSTLLSTCLPYQKELVNLLRDSGKRDKYFVICGGGPVTPEWVAEIGADGYGREAANAVNLCSQLVSGELSPPLEAPIVEGALKMV